MMPMKVILVIYVCVLHQGYMDQTLGHSKNMDQKNSTTVSHLNNVTMWIQNETLRHVIWVYMYFCPNQDMCLGTEMFHENVSLGLLNPSCSPCSCHDNCFRMSNCCPSKELADFWTNHTSRNVSKLTSNPILTCTAAESSGPLYVDDKAKKYWMVAYCPVDYNNEETVNRCLQDLSKSEFLELSAYRPVTSAVTNETYKNIHCAICHGEETTKIFRWKMYVKTNVIGDFPSIGTSDEEVFKWVGDRSSNFSIVFKPSTSVKDRVRTCYTDYIAVCNASGMWSDFDSIIKAACENQSFVSVVTDCQRLYKNIFCAICNKKNPYDSLKASCPDELLSYSNIPSDASVLFRVSPQNHDGIEYKHDTRCGSSAEIFDPKKGSCSPISCEPGFTLVGPKCQPLISEVNRAVLLLNAIVCSEEAYIPDFEKIYTNDTCDFYFRIEDLQFLKDKWKLCKWFTKSIRVTRAHSTSTMIGGLYDLHYSNKSHYSIHPMVHPNFTVYFNLARFVNPILRVQYEERRFPVNCLTPSVNYALAPWQVCPRVLVEVSRFYFRPDNLFFCFKEYDACVDTRFVRLSDDRIHLEVCIEQFKQAVRNLYTDAGTMVIDDYAFVIFLLIALVACLLQVISTVFLVENWTPVAISKISISSAYFIMISIQIVSRVFSLNEEMCGVVGMATHFLYICAAGWPCIVCLDLTRYVLLYVRYGIREQFKPHRFGYYVAVNLAICCTLIACNILPNVDSDVSLVGYSSSSCEIHSYAMNLYTLGLPLGLSLLLHLISFSVLHLHIRGVPSYTNSHELTSIKTFMRVAFLFWMSWIFDYLVKMTDISIFRSLQTLSVTITGIFIFISSSPVFSDG